MKKLFALLLILALCVSVCAFTVSCFGGDNQGSGSGTPGNGDPENPDDGGDTETPGGNGGSGNQGGGSTNDGPPTGSWLPID